MQARVYDGIKESTQVGVDASTQGGTTSHRGLPERVNEQVGVVVGRTEPGWSALTLADHQAGGTAGSLQGPHLT